MDEDHEAGGDRSAGGPASDQEQTVVPAVAVVGIVTSAGGLEALRLYSSNISIRLTKAALPRFSGVLPQCRLRRRAMAYPWSPTVYTSYRATLSLPSRIGC